MGELTHFNEKGRAKMVDVSEKTETLRIAVASGEIYFNDEVHKSIVEGNNKKGDVLAVAQVAAIMGTKRTSELIPMCHNILLSGVDMDYEIEKNKVKVWITVKTTGQTGVEMEALTGVNIALLTIYDMCKAIDKKMVIDNIRLEEKIGGKSGHFKA